MLDVRVFPLGVLQANCYLVVHDQAAVAVDPGGDPAAVVDYLRREGLTLEHILNSHLHFDHIAGNAALAEATGAPILASEADRFLLDTEIGGGGFMGLPRIAAFAFKPLEPGAAIFAGLPCTVLGTPGHSPGSLTFLFPDLRAAFVGDLIFQRSVGRTDFPGGDQKALQDSVTGKIFTLPADTALYPGHGPATSAGEEKTHNPFFGAMTY